MEKLKRNESLKASAKFRSRADSKPETMSSWLERQASSHQVQLAATALLSGVAVAGIIYGSQAIRRKTAVDELKASIPELDDSHHADMVNFVCSRIRWIRTDHPSVAYKLRCCLSAAYF